MSSLSTTSSESSKHLPAARAPGAAPRWQAARLRASDLLRRAEPIGQSAVLLWLRLVYGGLFAQTGWGKLAHLERTSGFFDSLGLPAPGFTAVLVGATELVGGVLLVLGAGTRLAAVALATVMGVALATAHAADAFASLTALTEQPPYPFLLAVLALAAFGAGHPSVDRALRRRRAD